MPPRNLASVPRACCHLPNIDKVWQPNVRSDRTGTWDVPAKKNQSTAVKQNLAPVARNVKVRSHYPRSVPWSALPAPAPMTAQHQASFHGRYDGFWRCFWRSTCQQECASQPKYWVIAWVVCVGSAWVRSSAHSWCVVACSPCDAWCSSLSRRGRRGSGTAASNRGRRAKVGCAKCCGWCSLFHMVAATVHAEAASAP